jgi:hypothetical protein
MQTASTRPCDSENRTDRSPIEDPSTGGLKSPRKLRAINYVPTDQPDPRPRPPTRTVIIEASPSIAASSTALQRGEVDSRLRVSVTPLSVHTFGTQRGASAPPVGLRFSTQQIPIVPSRPKHQHGGCLPRPPHALRTREPFAMRQLTTGRVWFGSGNEPAYAGARCARRRSQRHRRSDQVSRTG